MKISTWIIPAISAIEKTFEGHVKVTVDFEGLKEHIESQETVQMSIYEILWN